MQPYIIIEANSLSLLVEKVNKELLAGFYILAGGIATDTTSYYQAMVTRQYGEPDLSNH